MSIVKTDCVQMKKFGDRIKGNKLQGFGKLNFTYHGKLRCRSSSTVAAKYIYKGGVTRESRLLRLVYCGST